VIILIISGITGNRLDGYNVDKSAISVSGLSSGGYMTVQLHIAHSSMFMGAGIVAGGPFWCAQDDLEIALSSCMKDPSLISVDELVKITHNTALTDTIDPLTNLVDDKVYLFSGSKDTVIKPGESVNVYTVEPHY
jgi:predicted peptidase